MRAVRAEFTCKPLNPYWPVRVFINSDHQEPCPVSRDIVRTVVLLPSVPRVIEERVLGRDGEG